MTAEDTATTETYTVVVTRLRRVTTTPAAPPEVTVPSDWSLIPAGLVAGDQFRLLFLSSTKTDGESYDIADYNTFIQGLAAAGHTDIRTYSPGFRALGCTADSDARDNTATTGAGVVIYWLNGAKADDNYGDFYDGNWDDEANDKDESGANGPNTSQSVNYPLTGCDDDGTEDVDGGTSYALGESEVRVARPSSSAGNAGPLTSNSATAKANTRPMYGLSQVFEVAAAGNTPASGAPAITGAAQVGKELTAGLGTIADAEGLPGTFPDDYTLQWVRVDADGTSNEVDITGETSGTYTPVAGDVGKKIKVEVSFTDDGSNAEGPLVSAAWPSNAPVAAAAGACPTDNDWCTTLTVGFGQQGPVKFYGYGTVIPDGTLADTTIDDGDGTTWTVSRFSFRSGPLPGPLDDAVIIHLDAFLPRGSVFDLGGTTFTVEAIRELSAAGRYEWSGASLAWVHGQDVTVSVKLPENAPGVGRAGDFGDATGGRDADGRNRRHCRPRRASDHLPRRLHPPVDPGGCERDVEPGGCGDGRRRIYAGGRRRGQADQGEGDVHRRRRQRRRADERPLPHLVPQCLSGLWHHAGADRLSGRKRLVRDHDGGLPRSGGKHAIRLLRQPEPRRTRRHELRSRRVDLHGRSGRDQAAGG